MSETQTNTPDAQPKDPFDDILTMQEQAPDAFEDIIAMQASAAGKRIVEQAPKNNDVRNRLIATGVGAAILAGSGLAVHEAVRGPAFSQQSTTYSVNSGEGLYDIAKSIDGIDTIDIRDAVEYISIDPSNIDILKNGLQAGEQIEVPLSVNGADSSSK